MWLTKPITPEPRATMSALVHEKPMMPRPVWLTPAAPTPSTARPMTPVPSAAVATPATPSTATAPAEPTMAAGSRLRTPSVTAKMAVLLPA